MAAASSSAIAASLLDRLDLEDRTTFGVQVSIAVARGRPGGDEAPQRRA
jgi:hypothetical protein